MAEPDEHLQYALEVAYRYLNRRDRTEAEVRKHLRQKGLGDDAIDRATATLFDQGYLNDLRFAQLFVQDKQELEQWGIDRITRGLLARGIDRELIAATLDHEALDTELDRALALLHRRFPAPPEDRRDRNRALGVLVRKGFDGELALEALSRYGRADR